MSQPIFGVLAMPSGVLTVGAEARRGAEMRDGRPRSSFYRTARRLFDGYVYA